MIDAKEERFHTLWRLHQPEGDARNDTEVRLRKNAVGERAGTPSVERRSLTAGHIAVAGMNHFAVRKHNLEITGVGKVVTIRRVTESTLDCVPEHAAFGTGARRVYPQF